MPKKEIENILADSEEHILLGVNEYLKIRLYSKLPYIFVSISV